VYFIVRSFYCTKELYATSLPARVSHNRDLAMTASALRLQLAQIEAQIALLQSERHRLLEDLDKVAYPVTNLPNEISSYIFRHIIPEIRLSHGDEGENGGDADDDGRRYHQLLRLAGVCRKWRNMVLSTCALWNSMALCCDVVSDPINVLEAWLPRAGRLPLDVAIRVPPDHYSSIISVLCRYSSQWRHVHIVTTTSTWSATLPIERFPTELPLLETLMLSGFHLSESAVETSVRNAPGLHKLSLHTASEAIRTRLPLHLLTTLQFGTLTAAELLEVLAYTPTLEHLRVETSAEAEITVLPSLTLPCLHTFESNHNLSMLILQYLTLPTLTHVKLDSFYQTGVEALQACISRSGSTIRTLKLVHGNFRVAHSCFTALPTLTHVTLVHPQCFPPDMEAFCTAMESSGYLPKLESLAYEGCSSDLAIHFVNAITARYHGVEGTTKLTAVKVSFEEPVSEFTQALVELRYLGRQGLQLDMKNPADI